MAELVSLPPWRPVEQRRMVFENNLGIIFVISPYNRMLWVLIRIASTRTHNMFLWRNVQNYP